MSETRVQVVPAYVTAARENYARFLEHRRDAEKSFIQMGLNLLAMYAEGSHLAFGYDTWRAFVAAPVESGGCGINYRTAMRVMAVVDRWVLDLQADPDRLTDAGYSKLDIVRPYAEAGNRDEVLSDAVVLSESDLIEKYKGVPPPPEPKTYTCPKCGHAFA